MFTLNLPLYLKLCLFLIQLGERGEREETLAGAQYYSAKLELFGEVLLIRDGEVILGELTNST